ncbi:methyltransferase domain-containing protein [Candidatus Nitrospira salsa]
MNIAETMKSEWNRRAKHHARYWVATEDFHDDRKFAKSGKNTANALLSRVAPYSNSSWSILDIGCGVGRVLKPLASHFQHLIGIDISGEMIAHSKQWLNELNNVETRETSGVDLHPFRNESFDLVYSFVAFQHMPRPVFARYLEESHRVLKIHGYLAFQIPVGVPLDTAIEDTITMRQYGTHELAEELQRCGFQLIGETHLDTNIQSSNRMEPNCGIYLAKKSGAVIRPKNTCWLQAECGQAFSLLDTRMYVWYAEQCLQAGREKEALRTYEALRQQSPDSLEKWIGTVEVLVERGKLDEAQDTLEKLTVALPTYQALNTLLEIQKPHLKSNIS